MQIGNFVDMKVECSQECNHHGRAPVSGSDALKATSSIGGSDVCVQRCVTPHFGNVTKRVVALADPASILPVPRLELQRASSAEREQKQECYGLH